MSQMPLLIVDRTLPLPEELPRLLDILTEKFGIDAYTARQRLTGQGFSLFAGASRERVEKIAALLTRHGIANWIVDPTPPRFAPLRARGLEIGDDKLSFLTDGQQVILERGDRVVAILADLTGTLVQRNLEKLRRRAAYLGADAAAYLNRDESYRTVLQNQPVLDLYLLDEGPAVRQAIRFLAGRYDPSGLGRLKTHSTGGNLDAIVRLVREYAGEFILHTDFGVPNLPGCALKKLEACRRPDQTHLAPVTRFGWLMVDLHARQRAKPTAAASDPAVVGAVLGIPAAMATATGETLPGFEELTAAIQDAPEPCRTETSPTGRVLPPPPNLEPLVGARFRWQWLLFFVAVVIGGSGIGGEILADTIRFGLRTGTVPALFSLLFGGLGFRNFRVKRHIENLPTSKARSVAMGMVEVRGHVRRKYALVSPMTQQPCVFYLLRKYRRDKENRVWREYGATDCGPIPFDLEDDTGRLTVDPAGATIKAGQSKEEGRGTLGFALAGIDDADEKWVEEVIPEGAFVYVTGFARAPERAGGSLRERTIAALRALKQDRHRLRRYDADGDGRISDEEWRNAREAVEQQVLAESLDEQSENPAHRSRVVIGRPTRRALPFLIAEARSELRLARGYAFTAAAQLTIGFGLGIFALIRLIHFLDGGR